MRMFFSAIAIDEAQLLGISGDWWGKEPLTSGRVDIVVSPIALGRSNGSAR